MAKDDVRYLITYHISGGGLIYHTVITDKHPAQWLTAQKAIRHKIAIVYTMRLTGDVAEMLDWLYERDEG